MTTNRELRIDLSELDNFAHTEQMILSTDDHVGPDLVMELLSTLSDVISFIPTTLNINVEQDLICFLHYELENRHWYITHRDPERQQWRAFGMVDVGETCGRLDYICIHELLRAGVSVDLDWQPKPVSQVKLRT